MLKNSIICTEGDTKETENLKKKGVNIGLNMGKEVP